MAQANDMIENILTYLGLSIAPQSPLIGGIWLLMVIAIAWLSYQLTDRLLTLPLHRLAKHSRNQWDNILIEQNVIHRCAHVAPALCLYVMPQAVLAPDSGLVVLLSKVSMIYLILTCLGIASALLNSLEHIYNQSALANRAPITGFIQVGKLILVAFALLLIIAGLMDQSPLILLSGLGAMTAILMLIFRDTILGFVAGIQIAANHMVNNQDWIEIPQYGVDGEVIAVGLTTVKIRNWDKTISTLPTYKLISDAVKNWRGMQEAGGRRIKRAIYLDQQSIGFLSEQQLNHLSQLSLLRPYLDEKRATLSDWAEAKAIAPDDVLNRRRLTNIGTFRAYTLAYLQNHPDIRQDMTLIVRQLAPSPTGVGLEIYCFSGKIGWVEYEGIQADIFDHLLAILNEFGLRPYQHIGDGASAGQALVTQP